MNIAFLCGCLESGSDGVGDYTRRLAGELTRQGHRVVAIALNDRYASDWARGTHRDRLRKDANVIDGPIVFQGGDDVGLRVLRFHSSLSWGERIGSVREFLRTQSPDVVSLQFVPYSFHPKGIPFRLARRLQSIGGDLRWHLMCHELWVGLGSSPPFRHRLLGAIQRRILASMIARLRPCRVDSHASPYIELLGKFTQHVGRVPLFGNIPVEPQQVPRDDSGPIRFCYFGSVHDGWGIEDAAGLLHRIAAPNGRTPQICAIGSGGAGAAAAWQRFRTAGVPVEEHGRCDEPKVSALLQSCDFGLSASSPDLIEKSGAAAAMFEHGLPVVVTRAPIWGDRFVSHVRQNCPLAVFGDAIDQPMKLERRQPAEHALPEIARRFAASLSTN
ncbi:hypothetical protein Mal15_51230 [Stieleria maiorica]|uniref:Glycosyltransferase subfamily 4-like N-terminal domain-containing protein n=1 Tax=Stieleria maiorica TaxID=2795974 RepID=A0A5B9MMA7_9BACT|nr:glycosyltransferase family 4 protein [Stieleria maiorica]QEG01047.1 hypothetical protein Mal15_51230 [Stieleria maiorica]